VDGASGLIRKIEIDPKVYPVVKWSWKIDHTVKKGNERTKNGHDFAAKLYVIFPRGLFSSTRAIEYVWSNVMHKGEMLRSPYSKNVVMIAMDAGTEQAGNWISHRRNFAEDYRAAFGEEAPRVGAIAIMTDSDNTHESAIGYYGDITVAATAKEEGQKPKPQPVKEQQPKELKPKEPLPKEPHTLPKEQSVKEQPSKEQKPKEQLPKEQPHPAQLPPAIKPEIQN
jgi:hypothetical protein